MPWMRAVTAIRVVVARMIPSNVRKLRSLFLRSESRAIRVASQKEALKRKWRGRGTVVLFGRRVGAAGCSGKIGGRLKHAPPMVLKAILLWQNWMYEEDLQHR